MRSILHHRLLLGLCVAGLTGALAASLPLGTPVVRFPSPGDYPEGLAWDGVHLWSNNFTDGALYRLDPADGRVVGRYVGGLLPHRPEGLAWDGSHLWTVDWVTGVIAKVQVGESGVEVVAEYDKPAKSGRAVGLEHDGTHLWLACFGAQIGEKSELWQLDPTTLAPLQMLRLPVYWVEDLAWDGRWLWSVDWLFAIGFAIDRATGDTLHTYRTPGPNPVGMAWDGEYLWTTDTQADSIWALDISAARATTSRSSTWTAVKRAYR
jgi:sugar lactone lactonase YvrE